MAKPHAVPALLRALDVDDLRLASRAAATLWALIGLSERGKSALRSSAHLAQLRAAEASLATKAMVDPPRLPAEAALLGDCLKSVGAIMAILKL